MTNQAADRKKKSCGTFGEDTAVVLLRQKGFDIVARNLHVSHYEIDMIAENEHYLVFAEVKARTVPYLLKNGESPYAVTPAMAVNKGKQRRLISAAMLYLLEHPTSKQPRFDVVEVYLKPKGESFEILKIHHIEDAFGAS